MSCANGTCGVSVSGADVAAAMSKRADGACCAKCARKDRMKRSYGAHPMLRLVHGVRPSGAMVAKSTNKAPFGQPPPPPPAFVLPAAALAKAKVTCEEWAKHSRFDQERIAAYGGSTPAAIQAYCDQMRGPTNAERAPSGAAKGGHGGAPAPMGTHFSSERQFFFPRIDPAAFLYLYAPLAYNRSPCRWWWRLSPAAKIVAANKFADENPGAIPDAATFIAEMDAYCGRYYYGYGAALDTPLGLPAGGYPWPVGVRFLRSGDITIPSDLGPGDWVPSGTAAAGTARDDLMNTVSIDANGHPIQGTATGSDGTPIDDSDVDLGSLAFLSAAGGSGGDAGTGGSGSGHGLTDAQVAGITRDISAFITTTGGDIATAIREANATQRAEIAAGVHSQLDQAEADLRIAHAQGADQATIDRLQRTIDLSHQALDALRAQQGEISTGKAVAYGLGGLAVLGVLAKVAGVI